MRHRPLPIGAMAVVLAFVASAPVTGDNALRLEERYRHGLALWAAGSRSAGLAALAELEWRLSDHPGCLDWIEDDTATALASSSPEALSAVALLSRDLFAERVRSGRLVLPIRRLRTTAQIALRRHEADPADPRGRDEAVTLLTLIADAARAIRYEPTLELAAQFLDRALELRPDDPPAVALAADVAEKLGRFERAAAYWQRLALLVPDAPRASFGVALNLARAQPGPDALRRLEAVAAGPGPAWIRVLAHEELAMVQARQSPRIAAATLRRAAEDLPAAGFDVLAWVLDPRADARLAPTARPTSIPPRVRWDDGPTEEAAGAHADAARLLPKARAALFVGLSRLRANAPRRETRLCSGVALRE